MGRRRCRGQIACSIFVPASDAPLGRKNRGGERLQFTRCIWKNKEAKKIDVNFFFGWFSPFSFQQDVRLVYCLMARFKSRDIVQRRMFGVKVCLYKFENAAFSFIG